MNLNEYTESIILDPHRHAWEGYHGLEGYRGRCLRCGRPKHEHWGFFKRAVAWALRGLR